MVEVPDSDSVASGVPTFSDNSALQAKLDFIQKQLEIVTAKLAKGKGRGKKSQAQTPTSEEPPRPGLLNRLRTSFSGPSTSRDADQASDTSNSTLDDEPPPPNSVVIGPQRQARGTKKKTIYIQNVQLLLNGVGLDQIETNETEGKTLKI